MNEKAKQVIGYYVLCNKLKDIIRTGWKNWNVKKDRVESIAEHIFGVQSLAIAMWSQYEYNLDFNKVILMLAIHELEETIIGDLTMFEINPLEKKIKGHQAIKLVLKDLIKKDDLESLIIEFDERKTTEALFAYHCDKLECDIQSKLYDEGNYVDLNDQKNNQTFNNADVQNYLNSGKSWSDMWISFGRDRYNYDNNFKEVSYYVQNNKISIND